MHRQMKVHEENDNFQTKLTSSEGEINTRLKTKQLNLRLNQASQPDLEKLRVDMELTVLKCQYEEKQRERQHKEKMCFLQLQTSPAHVSLLKKQGGRVGSSRCVLSTQWF